MANTNLSLDNVTDIKGNTTNNCLYVKNATDNEIVWRRDRIIKFANNHGVLTVTNNTNSEHKDITTINNNEMTSVNGFSDKGLVDSGKIFFIKKGAGKTETSIKITTSENQYIYSFSVTKDNGENITNNFDLTYSLSYTMVNGEVIYKQCVCKPKTNKYIDYDIIINVTYKPFYVFTLNTNASIINRGAISQSGEGRPEGGISWDTPTSIGNRKYYFVGNLAVLIYGISNIRTNDRNIQSGESVITSLTNMPNATTVGFLDEDYNGTRYAYLINSTSVSSIKSYSWLKTEIKSDYTATINTASVSCISITNNAYITEAEGNTNETFLGRFPLTFGAYNGNTLVTSNQISGDYASFKIFVSKSIFTVSKIMMSITNVSNYWNDSAYNLSIKRNEGTLSNPSTSIEIFQYSNYLSYEVNTNRKSYTLSYSQTDSSYDSYWINTYSIGYYGDIIEDGGHTHYSNSYCKRTLITKWYNSSKSTAVHYFEGSRTGYDINASYNLALPYTITSNTEIIMGKTYTPKQYKVYITAGTGVALVGLSKNSSGSYSLYQSGTEFDYGTNLYGVVEVKDGYYISTESQQSGYWWNQDYSNSKRYYTSSSRRVEDEELNFGTIDALAIPWYDKISFEVGLQTEWSEERGTTCRLTSFKMKNSSNFALTGVNLRVWWEDAWDETHGYVYPEKYIYFYDSYGKKAATDPAYNNWDTGYFYDKGNGNNLAGAINASLNYLYHTSLRIEVYFWRADNASMKYCGGDSSFTYEYCYGNSNYTISGFTYREKLKKDV